MIKHNWSMSCSRREKEGAVCAGLSNILDNILDRRYPTERPHGKVVRALVVDGKLLRKIVQREESVAGIKVFLVLAVTAFHLAVVSERIRTYQLVPDLQALCSFFEEGRKNSLAIRKAVGKFKTVVGLDAFDSNTAPSKPLDQLF